VFRKIPIAWLCAICLFVQVNRIYPAPAVIPDSGETKADSILPQRANEEFVPKWYDMFTNLPGDWARYSQETFRTENIPAFLGIAALTGALIVTDDKTWDLSRRWRDSSTTVKNASEFFEYLGDGRPQFGLAGAFALYGFTMKDRRALRTSSQLVEVILACGAVVQVIKHVTGRQSPYVSSEPRGAWDFFPNQIDYAKRVPSYDAFPSGHLSTAMATMTVIFENYPELHWVKPVGYVVIGLIGVGMANTGIHWYSDYPLGVVLGYSFGVLVAHPVINGDSSSTTTGGKNISLSPSVTERGPGVTISFSF
jgi:membrane-associated PAP2 superfamily phosphatase